MQPQNTPVFMVRPGTGPRTKKIYTSPVPLKVHYDWDHRVVERRESPIGTITRLENTTRNRKRFVVTVGIVQGQDRQIYSETGTIGAPSWASRLTIKAGEQREHLRTMLPADVSVMADHDAEIAKAMGVVKGLREKRKRFIQAAWRRARPVDVQTLHDLVPEDQRS